jgi:putative ABC transport system permease protein
MIRNYFKIAWRNLVKNKAFSLINIFGLAVGLTCFLLIFMYIIDELSFDRHFQNAERIYRVNSDIRFGGTEMKMSQSGDPMGAVLKKDYPEVEQFTRLYTNYGGNYVKKGSEFIFEERMAHADSTFFDVFSLPILAWNPKTALDAPNTAAINKTLASKYFGTTEVIGKTLEIGDDQKTIYNITAVYEDIPTNTHFNFDILLSMDNVRYDFGKFLSHNFYTYVLLKNGTDYRAFNKKFVEVTNRYIFPQAKQLMSINTMEDFRKSGNELNYNLFPVTDIHLKSDRSFEILAGSTMQYIYIFGAVAFFLLLIACLNFMNLSTAKSANRSKEVGIRKVLGTEKKTLIKQFIAESSLTSYISFIISLLLIGILLPFFNDLTGKSFSYSNLFETRFLPLILLLPLFVGILAGYYPAFFLASYKPIEVLKSKLNSGFAKSNLRNILVMFQFTVSLILIVSTLVVYRQLNYIQTKNIGFNKDQVLIIDGIASLRENKLAFKNEVLQMSGVKYGSLSQYLPVSNSSRSDETFSTEAAMTEKNGLNMQLWKIDHDYIPTLNMEMASGRNFSKSYGTDSSGIIINETAAKMLGYDDPIGKKLYRSIGNNNTLNFTIVGVVKNFNFESLREDIGALCMVLGKSRNGMLFKINSENSQQLIGQIEAKWKSVVPEMPFSYRFLDDSFNEMYRAEQRIGKVALIFAFLTILIACLGLFGLVTYMTEQRVKEIGIRKVLGASEISIVKLLSKDFMKLVLISICIASPIAYFAMNGWLQDFSYRVSIEWWIFVLAGVGAILIAFFTVGYQAIKAALMNPIKSIKTE